MTLPALLLCYSRYKNLRPLIENLRNQGVSKFYISIDGQKKAKSIVREKFEQEIAILQKNSDLQIYVNQYNRNLGTSAAIISGIDWFFTQVNEGLIIEDDLNLSKDFVKFCKDALEYYKGDSSVWLVTGNQLFPDRKFNFANEFSTYPLIWGWATDRNRWNSMKIAMLTEKLAWEYSHSRRCKEYWNVGFYRAKSGRVDSWAILLAAQMHAKNKLCVVPSVNLASNVGIDEHATHTKSVGWPHSLPLSIYPNSITFAPISNASEHKNIDTLLEEKLYKIKYRHSFLPIKTYFENTFNPMPEVYELNNRLRNKNE